MAKSVPYGVALPIIGAAAQFEDEINTQMGTSTAPNAAVLTPGAAERKGERNTKVGAGRVVENCKICENPGHNARDCLLFMQREGACGHW